MHIQHAPGRQELASALLIEATAGGCGRTAVRTDGFSLADMRLITFVVATLWLPAWPCATADSTECDLICRLSSPRLAVRTDAVRELHPDRIGDLEPDFAVRAVLLAIQDSDPKIRRAALGGLSLLTAAVAVTVSPLAEAVARSLHSSSELRPALELIVSKDPSIDVAVAASSPLMALYGSDPAAQALLLDRIDIEADPVDRVRLISNLADGGIYGPETAQRLEHYLDYAAIMVQLKAAQLLVSGPVPPEDRFEDILRIIETPEAFADPTLLRALPRFAVPAEKYLPRLLALRLRLEEELQKPPGERTLAIYNDEYWLATLDDAIDVARAGDW